MITFLDQEFQHYNAHFSTYNKASVSLTLEDTSCYLQGRYIDPAVTPFQIETYKIFCLFQRQRPRVVQFSAVVRAS